MESQKEIEHFLILHKKPTDELRALCEGINMPTEGTRDALIQRILSFRQEPQNDINAPQVIPLRTRDEFKKDIPGALEFMQRVRAVIYNSKAAPKEFELLNAEGKLYKINMKCAKLTAATLTMILTNGMFYPHSAQRELVKALKTNPERFTLHLVVKPTTSGSDFVMVHCQRAA